MRSPNKLNQAAGSYRWQQFTGNLRQFFTPVEDLGEGKAMKEIYVGNLLYNTTYDEIETLFATYGTVYSLKLIAEARPRHPHAYAFVEMDDEAAEEAIRMLDGMEFFGRTLRVEEAMPEHALLEHEFNER